MNLLQPRPPLSQPAREATHVPISSECTSCGVHALRRALRPRRRDGIVAPARPGPGVEVDELIGCPMLDPWEERFERWLGAHARLALVLPLQRRLVALGVIAPFSPSAPWPYLRRFGFVERDHLWQLGEHEAMTPLEVVSEMTISQLRAWLVSRGMDRRHLTHNTPATMIVDDIVRVMQRDRLFMRVA